MSDRKEAVMAKCFRCKREMTDALTKTCIDCDIINSCDGNRKPPIPYTPDDTNVRCPDCNVASGGYHHAGCKIEVCPHCGGPFLRCSCLINIKDKSNADTYTIESAVEEIYEHGKDICLETGDVPEVAYFFGPLGILGDDEFCFTDEFFAMETIEQMIKCYQMQIIVLMSKYPLCKKNELPPGFFNSNEEIMHIYAEDKNTNLGILLEYRRGENGRIQFAKKFIYPKGKAIGQMAGLIRKF